MCLQLQERTRASAVSFMSMAVSKLQWISACLRMVRSRLLYGMLNGLLHKRGRRLLRSVQNQNGYEAWRLLSKDLMPKTRNRVLALLRTINSWPSFDAKQGLAQQLLRLETAFEEYERLEPGGLPENNKMATLLSCLGGQLRQHANVVISDDSTYRDLRELVLRWDGANTKWQTSVASSYGLSDGKKGLHDVGDAVPMDVDRVNAKGDKGKGNRGKPKGVKVIRVKVARAKAKVARTMVARATKERAREARTGARSLDTTKETVSSSKHTCKAMRKVPDKSRPVRLPPPMPAQAPPFRPPPVPSMLSKVRQASPMCVALQQSRFCLTCLTWRTPLHPSPMYAW